jgi:hypothetical protein
MLEISYIGRFGNNLCQYVFGRLLAVRNNLKLVTEWNHPEMIQFTPNPDGTVDGEVFKIKEDGDRPNLDWLETNLRNRNVQLRGYFQHCKFYDENKAEILSWMVLPAIADGHENDVVCHLRLDDYDVTGGIPIVDQSWYVDILRQHPDKKVYFVVEQPKKGWERKYMMILEGMMQGRPFEVVSGTARDDFYFIREFGTIVASNSSYAWWAAWLSNAKTIYTFKRWRLNSIEIALAVAKGMTPTDGRYIWERDPNWR